MVGNVTQFYYICLDDLQDKGWAASSVACAAHRIQGQRLGTDCDLCGTTLTTSHVIMGDWSTRHRSSSRRTYAEEAYPLQSAIC